LGQKREERIESDPAAAPRVHMGSPVRAPASPPSGNGGERRIIGAHVPEHRCGGALGRALAGSAAGALPWCRKGGERVERYAGRRRGAPRHAELQGGGSHLVERPRHLVGREVVVPALRPAEPRLEGSVHVEIAADRADRAAHADGGGGPPAKIEALANWLNPKRHMEAPSILCTGHRGPQETLKPNINQEGFLAELPRWLSVCQICKR